MPLITKRTPFDHQNPFRPVRPVTSKIIFLAFEGSATEEEYFEQIAYLFSEIKSKIQFISVAEDAVHTNPKFRTPAQKSLLSKCRPKQLVERIDQFKIEKDSIYQFSQYPEDEFWIVTDVDKNWSNEKTNPVENKTYLDEWNETVTLCHQKNYGYAISNPFFEVWLLLHHDNANEVDKSFAVTDINKYSKTNHFLNRLRDLGVPLKKEKHINPCDYDAGKVKTAISRAEELHIDKTNMCPKYFATTVYILLKKMIDMVPRNS